jgi:hypothetical protein
MKSRTIPSLRYLATAQVKRNCRSGQFAQVNAPSIAPWNGSEQTWQNGASILTAPAAHPSHKYFGGSTPAPHPSQQAG